MSKFFRKTTIFIFTFIVYFGLNYGSNLYLIKTDKSLVGFNQFNTLIAGDSQPMKSLDPSVFTGAANICQGAEPYYITYWKLKKILSMTENIKTVILGFSFHNISAYNDKKLFDRKWSTELFKRIYTIEQFNSLKNLKIDWVGYYQILVKKMCLYPSRNHIGYWGGYSKTIESNIRDYDTAITRHYYYKNEAVGVSSTTIEYLYHIIELCKKKHIKLFLVSSPLHDEYSKRIPIEFKEKYRQLKSSIIESGIKVFDYSKMSFEDSEFCDSNHLSQLRPGQNDNLAISALC